MAHERLTLRKIREILRLKQAGLSNRAIARACQISNSTVGEYLHRAETAGLHWPLPEGLSEDELYQELSPETGRESALERPAPEGDAGKEEGSTWSKSPAILHRKILFNLLGLAALLLAG
jgi:hypothetical protein